MIYLFFNSFTVEGEGGGFKFMFYFSPSFDMWKEEGKGPCFFRIFIVKWVGGSGFFSKKYVEGGWEQ